MEVEKAAPVAGITSRMEGFTANHSDDECIDQEIDLSFMNALCSLTPESSTDEIQLCLEHVARVSDSPVVLDQIMSAVDLQSLTLCVLLEREPKPCVSSLCLAIMVNIMQRPGSLDRIDPGTLTYVFNRFSPLMEDDELVYWLARLMRECARDSITASFFEPYRWFITTCTGLASNERIATEGFKLVFRILSCNPNGCKPWEWFTNQPFAYAAVGWIGRRGELSLEPACRAFGALCLNNRDSHGIMPSDFVEIFNGVLIAGTDLQQAAVFQCIGFFVDTLIIKFVQFPGFVKGLINLISDGSFAISVAAARLFSHMLLWFSAEMEPVFVEYGSLNFMIRFFETKDMDVIDTILTALSVAAGNIDQYFPYGKWTRMCGVVHNSIELVDTLKELKNGDYMEEGEELKETMEEALSLILNCFLPTLELHEE